MRDIDVIQRELPIELLEFFMSRRCRAPKITSSLPARTRRLMRIGIDTISTTPAQYTRKCRDEWERAYTMAWQHYYTVEHAEMIKRRAAVTKANVSNAVFLLT